MKPYLAIVACACLMSFTSCDKKEDNPVTPEVTEDLTFPANSTKHAVTLYPSATTVHAGENFDVKVILYGVSAVFGATAEITFAPTKVEVLSLAAGTDFFPAERTLSVSRIETDSSRVSFGVTYKAGDTQLSTGSGVMFKIKCRALTTGAAAFTINASTLSLTNENGTAITGFSTLTRENTSVTVN